jgi:hypothetical protein
MSPVDVSPMSHSCSPKFPVFQAYISRLLMFLVFSLLLVSCSGHGGAVGTSNSWAVDTSKPVWVISFGSGKSFPQYGALDTASGYLRLVPTTQSNWGTSVVIFPAFWSGGVYYQGTTIAASHSLSGNNLVIDFTGTLGGLSVVGRLTIFPPDQQISAQVEIVSATGNVVLDNRPGEAFKLAMLSSMHISDTSGTHSLPMSAVRATLFRPAVGLLIRREAALFLVWPEEPPRGRPMLPRWRFLFLRARRSRAGLRAAVIRMTTTWDSGLHPIPSSVLTTTT